MYLFCHTEELHIHMKARNIDKRFVLEVVLSVDVTLNHEDRLGFGLPEVEASHTRQDGGHKPQTSAD